jgi:predicted nucleotidyltransferase component of viral defense system
MIPARELLNLRTEWQLDVGVIEKDYVLGWVLAGIANEPELANSWVFKGGTCLRKCYYETYRFSEDLDFTIVNGGPETPEDLTPIFGRIAEWLADTCGLALVLDERAFVRRKNLRGNATTQGRIGYRGPTQSPSTPKLKLDITSDETLVERPVLRPVGHQYSDGPLPVRGVACYTITELFAEKLRALAQRCRPRDLYDVVHIHRHPDLIGRAPGVSRVLATKSEFVGLAVPDIESIRSSPFRSEIEQEWVNMLGHQLPLPTPPFAGFWDSLEDVFAWLGGRPSVPLPRAEVANAGATTWAAPRAITSWRRGVPLELIRYAGANRLKVMLDYRPERGRHGPRLVEPYSLRQSNAGDLLLFVVNDQGFLRSYRVDRIAGVQPTTESFRPRFRVEF